MKTVVRTNQGAFYWSSLVLFCLTFGQCLPLVAQETPVPFNPEVKIEPVTPEFDLEKLVPSLRPKKEDPKKTPKPLVDSSFLKSPLFETLQENKDFSLFSPNHLLIGGLDGGGGGFLYFRVKKAIFTLAKMLERLHPQDLTGEAKKQSLDFYRSLFADKQNFLVNDFRNTKVRLFPAKNVSYDISFYVKGEKVTEKFLTILLTDPKAGSDLKVAENFWDGTLGQQGTDKMSSIMRSALWELLWHLELQGDSNEIRPRGDIGIFDLLGEFSTLLMDSYLKKYGTPEAMRQLFSHGETAHLYFNEFSQLPEKTLSFKDRLKIAEDFAKKAVLDENHWANFSPIPIAENLAPSSSFDGFFANSGQAKNDGIQFTESARFAPLEELVFLVLHEWGHYHPDFGKRTENEINDMAWRLTQKISLELPKIPSISRENLKTKKWVKIVAPRFNDLPVLYLEPSTIDETWQQDSVDRRNRRKELLCRKLGFKNSITHEKIDAAQSLLFNIEQQRPQQIQADPYRLKPWIFESITCEN